jgi:hypothetical protein
MNLPVADELHTADDIARARIELMAFRASIPTGYAAPGSGTWLTRVFCCQLETTIAFRAFELGLEDLNS